MHTDQIHMHQFPIILDTTAQSHTEDQGMARIMEVPGADPDQGVFVRIHSWHKLGLHPAAESQVPLGPGWIAAVDQNNLLSVHIIMGSPS